MILAKKNNIQVLQVNIKKTTTTTKQQKTIKQKINERRNYSNYSKIFESF